MCRGGHLDLSALEDDGASIRLLSSGQDLDQRALTCAVVTDECGDLAGLHIEIGSVQGDDLAVGSNHSPCFKQGH